MAQFWETNRILHVVAGSRSQGLATPASDTDTRGVCIPPREVLLGLNDFEQHTSDSGDHVTFALAKFVRLALAGNPNAIEMLHTHPDDVLSITDLGHRLIAARDLFLTRNVGERFFRYAEDQLARLERHHRWLTEPAPALPDPGVFGGQDVRGHVRFPDADAERAFRAARQQAQHYRRWRANRNPDQAALEERYGYDTKHAMHLCRLLMMGHEILTTGEVHVRRPDAHWLRSIRDGAMSYDELRNWAREYNARLPTLTANSDLPERPDEEAADRLIVELHAQALGCSEAEDLQ
jgi:predicted nucleotidyltransferase